MVQTKIENSHARMDSRSTVGILLIGIVIVSLIVIPVSAAKLATPIQISPANNQHFNHYPQYTTLVCKPVTGADRYEFIVECKLDSSPSYYTYKDTTETVPYYTFEVPALQSGRWCVIAHDSGGRYTSSTPSAWRTFDYWTYFRNKLPTPVLLSPPNNAIFYHYPRETTLTWRMVPGASGYDVEVQNYDPSDKSWHVYKHEAITGLYTSYYNFKFIGAQKGRWRVFASSEDVAFTPSDYSAWRTFTYKA